MDEKEKIELEEKRAIILEELNKPQPNVTQPSKRSQIISGIASVVVFAIVALVYFLFLNNGGGLKTDTVYSYNEAKTSITINSGDITVEQIKSQLKTEWENVTYTFTSDKMTMYVNDVEKEVVSYKVVDNAIFTYQDDTPTQLTKLFDIKDNTIYLSYTYTTNDVNASVILYFSR